MNRFCAGFFLCLCLLEVPEEAVINTEGIWMFMYLKATTKTSSCKINIYFIKCKVLLRALQSEDRDVLICR